MTLEFNATQDYIPNNKSMQPNANQYHGNTTPMLHQCFIHIIDATDGFIEISIEVDILLGGKHEARFVLGVAGIEPMPS
jgi:hypothetical protein